MFAEPMIYHVCENAIIVVYNTIKYWYLVLVIFVNPSNTGSAGVLVVVSHLGYREHTRFFSHSYQSRFYRVAGRKGCDYAACGCN